MDPENNEMHVRLTGFDTVMLYILFVTGVPALVSQVTALLQATTTMQWLVFTFTVILMAILVIFVGDGLRLNTLFTRDVLKYCVKYGSKEYPFMSLWGPILVHLVFFIAFLIVMPTAFSGILIFDVLVMDWWKRIWANRLMDRMSPTVACMAAARILSGQTTL